MKTSFIGKYRHQFLRLTSTNDWMMNRLSEEDFLDGTIVISNHQTKGRGQRGSSWVSKANESLTFSILLKPTFVKTSEIFGISICVALGIFDCLSSFQSGFKIKWPNDIYFQDKKIGGVLIENVLGKTNCHQSIIGIGLNVNQLHFNHLPNAISLKQIIKEHISIESLLDQLCKTIEFRYLQLQEFEFTLLKNKYLENLYLFNEKHCYKIFGKLIYGEIVDVMLSGRLQLKLEDGRLCDFDIKEVSF